MKRWGGKVKTSEVWPPSHAGVWPPYDDSHQNHNCLHCRPAEVFNFQVDLFFPGAFIFSTKKRGRKPRLFSLNFWLLFKWKLLSCKGGEWERWGVKPPSRSYYCVGLCRTGRRDLHPDARHNMDHSAYHLVNIIRWSNAFLTLSNWPSHFIIINIRYL